jgi:hypothetical protein
MPFQSRMNAGRRSIMRLSQLRHGLAGIELLQKFAIFLFGPRLAGVRGRAGAATSTFGASTRLQRTDRNVQRADNVAVLKH